MTWKDGDAFDWSASPVTQQDYGDISDTSICFTFDIENTDQLGLEDCLQNNRELCTLPVEVNTVTGGLPSDDFSIVVLGSRCVFIQGRIFRKI